MTQPQWDDVLHRIGRVAREQHSEAIQNFRCPNCGSPVQEQEEELSCTGCAARFPVSHGIFDFRQRRRDYYFNPVPRDAMAKLIRAAGSVPWDATVREFLRYVGKPSDWVDNLAANGRYSWKLLLELRPDARVLDFGCGLGNLTSNLAPHVAEVVALDLTWERLLFAQKRFEQFNVHDNITLVAGGDGKRLPFPDASFDCIALSGVLEWVADDGAGVPPDAPRHVRAWKMLASFFGETNPRRIQLGFLRELRRILKPDGQLMVAIENRFGYEYFAGRPDHHSGLPLASLMPRLLANLYSIVAARRPYRTYTHSYPGFRRLFSAAKYQALEFYGLAPGYSGLAEIIPADTRRPCWAPAAPRSWKEGVKRSRYFVPAFGIVAGRTGTSGASFLERMLRAVATSRAIEPDALKVSRLCVSQKDKAILFLEISGRSAIAKVPWTDTTRAGEENNWSALHRLAAMPAPVATLAPEPIARQDMQGITLYLESAVPGHALQAEASESSRARWAALIGDFLAVLNPGLERIARRPLDPEAFEALVARPLERVRRSAADKAACDAALRYFRDHLSGVPMRLGFTHGDLTRSNVFVQNGALSGVIDWEYANQSGLPALDAITYVESFQRLLVPSSRPAENLENLAKWKWTSEAELELVRGAYEASGIDSALHPVLCHLNWLHHISHRLGTTSRFSPHYVEQWVQPLLARLATA